MGRKQRSRQARVIAMRMAAMLGVSGVLHLARPRTFDGIVPESIPGPARLTTYVSGAAEIAIAAGLAVPRTRRVAGLAAALLFVAVFPANLKMAKDALDDPTSSRPRRIVSVLRLPLQVPLVAWAMRVRRHG